MLFSRRHSRYSSSSPEERKHSHSSANSRYSRDRKRSRSSPVERWNRFRPSIKPRDGNKKLTTQMYLDLEKLDEAAVMFKFLTSSGILSKNHVFYEQVHSFCTSAMGLVDEQVLPQMYPALYKFQHAVQFNFKPVASYLLFGRGKHGKGRSHRQTPQEYVDTHNLSFFHPRTIIKNSPPGHFTSGVIREDVEVCIQMCKEKNALAISSDKLCGYLCCLSTDEMAIKPFLEYSPAQRTVIGLSEPEQLTFEDISKFESSEEIMAFLDKQPFVVQAKEVRISSMDDQVNFPVGVFYCGSKSGASHIKDMFSKVLGSTEQCLMCLQNDKRCTFLCEACYNDKDVCDQCSEKGYTDWHPLLCPCEVCIADNSLCIRLVPLVWCTDCDPKQKSFMNTMLNERSNYPYQVPIPDCRPHNIKSVRSAEFCNVTLIAGSGEQGHANGGGRKAKFNKPSGFVEYESKLFICDQGNSRLRVVDVSSLFCHASRIAADDEVSPNEDEECAVCRVCKVAVTDLTPISETDDVTKLQSPYAVCSSASDDRLQLFISDIRLCKIFEISNLHEEESQVSGHVHDVWTFGRSSVLTSLALTRDKEYLLVGDCNENAPCIHLCHLESREEKRMISNVPGPMGIGITEQGTLFISSSKGHGLYSAGESDMLQNTAIPSKVCGDSQGHRDGIKSQWNRPTDLCTYRNTVFVCDTGNKAVRMVTSAKKLVPIQNVMAKYAHMFRIDKEATQNDMPGTFNEHLKLVEEVNSFFARQEQEAFERTGKRNTNGPDMTVPRCTRQSFRIVLDSLTSLSNTLTEIGKDGLLDRINFASLTTLSVECFFKAMRADHDMPTVAGYANRRARCVEDDIMRIYQKGFSYFTGPNSFYPEKIITSDPPTMASRATKKVLRRSNEEREEDKRQEMAMREFASEYGRGVRQENVRSKSKENTGTLPYALSMRPTIITAAEEGLDVITDCQSLHVVNQGTYARVRVLHRREDVIAVRHNSRREPSPYWLAVLMEDVCAEMTSGRFAQKRMKLRWLNQTDDPLTYVYGDTSFDNSPNCILSEVRGVIHGGEDVQVPPEEDVRLSRLANGDSESDREDECEEELPGEPNLPSVAEQSLPQKLPGVSQSGRRTTRFVFS
ncbi:predicted protein [Nematostella vectensis]|uniref:Uncharacterized protein n=1 Tax=Nematostella vectensis TaxID=45351 RepID=A7RQ69_NEMVE|nr:predicted protein [Nematostella vectensis]|eukprot:XP_001638571.1 predicted protein [Nematostella vectensis]